ncbi:hypothetical protein GQ42DRAFT_111838, partial [Ramicandelaber brevisporus]
TLMGETSASRRPVNSLLEEDLEWDSGSKPVPVITQETTTTLEDMIKQRIIDGKFDDVVRKRDIAAKPFRPSERVEVDDSKPQQSLAEVYEQDYMKKNAAPGTWVDAKDAAVQQQHLEVRKLVRELFAKLDALSDFHYVPNAPDASITIVSDTAAIEMEEVIPLHVSEATGLAPEEVYDKKRGDVKADTELDKDERKRLRNRKKRLAKQRSASK